MPKSLLDVRGIGESTAKTLSEHGYHSAEDLARAKIEELTAIQGFSSIRAESVIEDAKALLSSVANEKDEKPEAKVKKDQSKKKKKGKKEKKQKNGKKKSPDKDQSKKKKKNKSKKTSQKK